MSEEFKKPMSNKAKKDKGDRLEKYVVDTLRKEVDKNTHRIDASGAGLDKNDVRIPKLDIEIECKNANRFSVQDDWGQLESQLTAGMTGVLAIRHPKYPEFNKILIVCDFNDWLELIKKQNSEVEVVNSFAPEDRWKIKRAIEALKLVEKIFIKNS